MLTARIGLRLSPVLTVNLANYAEHPISTLHIFYIFVGPYDRCQGSSNDPECRQIIQGPYFRDD